LQPISGDGSNSLAGRTINFGSDQDGVNYDSIQGTPVGHFDGNDGHNDEGRDCDPSTGVHHQSSFGTDEKVDPEGYQYSDPDLDSVVVGLGSVVKRSVAGSTVEGPTEAFARPRFSHASVPADIGRACVELGQSRGGQSLGRATPSLVSSGITIAPAESDESLAENDGDEPVLEGGIDPDRLAQKIMSRPPSEPIKVVDPIVRVIYDDSSSASSRLSPDLFPQLFRAGMPARTSPGTPSNTIASPKPFIEVTPATPVDAEKAGMTDGKAEAEVNDAVDESWYQSTVGHTGASTPEKLEGIPGTATINGATMTEHGLEEADLGARGFPQTSDKPSRPTQSSDSDQRSSDGDTRGEAKDGSPHIDQVFISSGNFDVPSSYDSDPVHINESRRSNIRQDYNILYNHFETRKRSISHGTFGGRRFGDAENVPASTHSLSRVIIDLEEMLNQAIELAGRAVRNSNSALDERDASVRSLQGSANGSNHGSWRSNDGRSNRPSVLGSAYGGTESAVTALESLASRESLFEREHDLANTTGDHGRGRKKQKSPMSDLTEIEGSTVAVYSNSRNVSSPNLPQNTKQAKNRDNGRPEYGHEEKKDTGRRKKPLNVPSDNFSTLALKSNRGLNAKSSISVIGEEQRFRMEVGRGGEILLIPMLSSQTPYRDVSSSDAAQKKDKMVVRRSIGGWNWGLWGKRYAATVACGVVALVGWIVGNYRAELPKIQQHLRISSYTASLGNIIFFTGLAIPTIFLWPLPLLHGRKPYLLTSISLLLPLQLPQALSLPPYTADSFSWARSMYSYTVCFLVFRSFSGVILGMAFMNAMATLVDLFGPVTGACCRGGVVYENDINGGRLDQFPIIPGGEAGIRMGNWVWAFAWLFSASPGIGFLIGKLTVSHDVPAWGFWTIDILAGVLLVMIIMAPEVRPPWKKMGQSRRGERTERGEIKLVVSGSSPRWWWEEVWAGLKVTGKLLRQTGLLVVALYFGWIFGHLVVVMKVSSAY
jgi:hypothetical protein